VLAVGVLEVVEPAQQLLELQIPEVVVAAPD
jgi:hypothetical protein